MIELKITGNEAHQRLDRFLRKYLKDHPLGDIYKNIRTGKVKVNGQKEPENFMLASGDKVQLFIDDIQIHQEKAKARFEEKSDIIDIAYEDENFIAVNKPVGMLTHPDKEADRDTLVDRVQWYLRKLPGTKSLTFAPSACNRLDRNTGGLVIVAKNYASLRLMNKMIRERKISKYYLCIVKGFVKKDGEIKETIVKDEKKNKSRIGRPGDDDARDSHTIYKVLMRNNNYSLLEVELVTGRPHQIRAHFSSIGHPLYGDVKYGGGKESMDSQFLFAYKIIFPEGEDHLLYLKDKVIEAPLPKAFEEVMKQVFDKNRDTVKKSAGNRNDPPREIQRTEGRPESRHEVTGERKTEGRPDYRGEKRPEGLRNGAAPTPDRQNNHRNNTGRPAQNRPPQARNGQNPNNRVEGQPIGEGKADVRAEQTNRPNGNRPPQNRGDQRQGNQNSAGQQGNQNRNNGPRPAGPRPQRNENGPKGEGTVTFEKNQPLKADGPKVEGQKNEGSRNKNFKQHRKPRPGQSFAGEKNKETKTLNEQPTINSAENADARANQQDGRKQGLSQTTQNKKYHGNKNKRSADQTEQRAEAPAQSTEGKDA